MRRSRKHAASVATVLVAMPLLTACIAYLRLDCGEYDPCETGGSMPYAPVAFLLAVAVALLAAGLLVAIWKAAPESDD